jgi:hypothetical protein
MLVLVRGLELKDGARVPSILHIARNRSVSGTRGSIKLAGDRDGGENGVHMIVSMW